MKNNDLTLLIDADSLLYMVAHLDTVQEAIEGLDEKIHNILLANSTNRYVMFLTAKDCFRCDVAKSAPYKGNRKNRDKPKWLGVVTQYMIAQYKAVYYKGLEADDCVTYFQSKIENNRICAIDKDVIYSTPGSHFNYQMVKADRGMPQFKGLITVTEKEATIAYQRQLLTGDTGDNILGCGDKVAKVYGPKAKKAGESYEARVGVGPVEAEKIIGEGISISDIFRVYAEKYGPMPGSIRFEEVQQLIYMLRTDEDMMREVGYIPELPEIQTYEMPEQEEELDSWA